MTLRSLLKTPTRDSLLLPLLWGGAGPTSSGTSSLFPGLRVRLSGSPTASCCGLPQSPPVCSTQVVGPEGALFPRCCVGGLQYHACVFLFQATSRGLKWTWLRSRPEMTRTALAPSSRWVAEARALSSQPLHCQLWESVGLEGKRCRERGLQPSA